jgi:hypothetical protein
MRGLALSTTLLLVLAPAARANVFDDGRRVQSAGAGLVVLTDPVLDRIVVLDVNGERPRKLTAFGAHGAAPGQVLSPHGAAINSLRELFVADTMNHRVQVFDLAPVAMGRAPRLVRAWGSYGADPGQFDTPRHGVAIPPGSGGDHLVYVVDSGNHRIQVFDSHRCRQSDGWSPR